ncbi:NAD(P)-dependent oxidoreductase [Paenibacillus allorhizosphaerae]|uniref:2-(Hydroxymethyl)glutarate dehydrogenase n=1 Tax=Paenibacillus allorhizosphaerae TaxID=2849866 RepID=A0ABM8VAK6_9BACL|nr:NAD(P)-dependent oxidoreductase [Paenibacillus allorhizosphaerae]CAG7616822.1 2-(hydroxymethyl)glutarate dehydrogenase [Paenibacillus allorhizosphaerae]
MPKKVGFIGLGAMGRPMSKNVIAKGKYELTVYDLFDKAVEELVSHGARAATSAAEVAENSDIVITMLPNSPDVEAAVLGPSGVLSGLRPGSVLIDMSTIDPATTRKIADAVHTKGCRMLDAPVGRSTANAEDGTLLIMAGGDEDLFEECKPILSCMGSDLVHCGPIGSGEIVKIVNNMLTGIIVTANAEALTLGVKAGVKLETLLQVLRSTAANNGHLHATYPVKALKGDFSPGFAVRLAYKDMNLALSLGGQLNVPLSVAASSTQLFNMARGLGHDNHDYTSVISVVEECAGIKVRTE